jgi:quercetin dioxygenase-like cupin family protein
VSDDRTADGEDARLGDAAQAVGGAPGDDLREADEASPHFVELWNDYDPSLRFVALFPVGEEQGATLSSVAYYIIEPGRHTGVHSDNAEEVAFVAEGSGEAFVSGRTQRLEAGRFVVFAGGVEHDIYAHGVVALRLLSFFPTSEILSTFQQLVYPLGGNTLSSKPPRPVVTQLDPEDLPEGFPFDLAELGLGGAERRETPPASPGQDGAPAAERPPAEPPADG